MQNCGIARSATLRAGSSAMWFLVDKSGEAGLDNWEVGNEDYGFCCFVGERCENGSWCHESS